MDVGTYSDGSNDLVRPLSQKHYGASICDLMVPTMRAHPLALWLVRVQRPYAIDVHISTTTCDSSIQEAIQ